MSWIGVLWQDGLAPRQEVRGSEGVNWGDSNPKVSHPQEALFAVDPGRNWQKICAALIGRLLENSSSLRGGIWTRAAVMRLRRHPFARITREVQLYF